MLSGGGRLGHVYEYIENCKAGKWCSVRDVASIATYDMFFFVQEMRNLVHDAISFIPSLDKYKTLNVDMLGLLHECT
jgi:hypothetical protein